MLGTVLQQGPGGWVWVMGRIGHFEGLFRAVEDTIGAQSSGFFTSRLWHFGILHWYGLVNLV